MIARVSPRTRTWLAVLLPAAAAGVADSWHLGRQSMIGTEAVTFWAAGRSPWQLVRLLHHVDIVHGLYYATVHVCFDLFGRTTLVMRLPSLAGTVLAVAVTAAIARRVTGSNRAAFLCGGVLATLPALAGYAQIGRSYAIITGLVAGLTLLLLRALEDPGDRRRWLAYAALATVTIYLHEFAVLALVAHGVTVVWSRSGRRTALTWLGWTTCAVVAAAPLILYSTTQSQQVGYLTRTHWSDVRALVLDYFGPAPGVALLTIALALVAVGSDLRRRAAGAGLTVTRVGLPLLVLPGGLLLAESAVARPFYSGDRYVLYGTVGVALLVGRGADRVLDAAIGQVRGRTLVLGRLVAAAVLVGLFLSQLPEQSLIRSARNAPENLVGAAAYLDARSCAGDGIVLDPRSLLALRLAYPADLRGLVDVDQRTGSQRSGTLYGRTFHIADVRARTLAKARVWVAFRTDLRHTRNTILFLRAHGYLERSERMFGDMGVALMVRTGGWLVTHGHPDPLPPCRRA